MRKYKVHKFEIYTATAHKNDTEFFKNMMKIMRFIILETMYLQDLKIKILLSHTKISIYSLRIN